MTAITPRKADLEAVSERLPEVVNQFRRDARRGCGPSRAHRVRLLRACDDPLRARGLQGFRSERQRVQELRARTPTGEMRLLRPHALSRSSDRPRLRRNAQEFRAEPQT